MFIKQRHLQWLDCLIILNTGLVLRGAVSLWSYSGASTPPMFGDYEAQRHWQEITLNVPTIDWYSNTSQNHLLYWGLDYPPLTAVHSYLLGMWANWLNSSYVALDTSRGHESSNHKTFMRGTVLLADLLIFLPACVQYAMLFNFQPTKCSKNIKKQQFLQTLVILVLFPGLILIDNGHFQYNNISLGLFLLAVTALAQQSFCKAAIFFSLALNYKQMELYHALPIFLYLLKACLEPNSWSLNMRRFLCLSLVTVTTFGLLWWPWLSSLESLLVVVRRLFPLQRGLYEDKVANFWCSFNILYKIRNHFTNHQIVFICLATTVMTIIPNSMHNFFFGQWRILLYSLFNTSLAFFLFSFQVHEKSILLVALPMGCLHPFEGSWSINFLHLSIFSLYPLMIKDGLVVPYYILLIGYYVICRYILPSLGQHNNERSIVATKFRFQSVIIVGMISMSLLALILEPPKSLPYFWSTIISLISSLGFMLYAAVGNFKQLKNN